MLVRERSDVHNSSHGSPQMLLWLTTLTRYVMTVEVIFHGYELRIMRIWVHVLVKNNSLVDKEALLEISF